ncbi:MAG: hypothetical protein SGCHY_002189, partial [Lobulomycetales sp.]
MFEIWNNQIPFAEPTPRQMDDQQTCLVDFPEQKFAECTNGMWHCCWTWTYDKNDANVYGQNRPNTEVLDPRFGDTATHCHGGGWGSKSNADLNWKYRKEIFNHVVCIDHGYTRGYNRGMQYNNQAVMSCGCSEEMPLVTKVDCTEAKPQLSDDEKYAEPDNDYEQKGFKAQACEGKTADGADEDNKLDSFYRKMHILKQNPMEGMNNPFRDGNINAASSY